VGEWSGGLGAGCLAGAGVGFGEPAEGDLEAEGAELADVVGDLPAHAGLAFVAVRAEVLIPRAGGGQQRVVDLQLGVADRDTCFGLAAAPGDPPVAGALAGLGFPGGDGGLAEQAAEVPVALLGLGLCLLHRAGQLERTGQHQGTILARSPVHAPFQVAD